MHLRIPCHLQHRRKTGKEIKNIRTGFSQVGIAVREGDKKPYSTLLDDGPWVFLVPLLEIWTPLLGKLYIPVVFLFHTSSGNNGRPKPFALVVSFDPYEL